MPVKYAVEICMQYIILLVAHNFYGFKYYFDQESFTDARLAIC